MNIQDWNAMQRKLTSEAKRFLLEAYGIELNIPVLVNGRLKRRYGQFVYNQITQQPLKIEIGKNYITHQDWETIRETLLHECIHYALFTLGKPFDDGEPLFEAELKKHGSHSTGTVKYRGKVVEYGCPRCNAIFRRKKRYPRNGAGYQCSTCKVDIKFLGEKVV
ncbi:sprT domain-containing protein [Bacillus cereus]|nr:sprT domain-containing protein [Bacillus cereus]